MLKIKEICKEKGITLTELANRLGIKYQSLRAAMTGNPTLLTMKNIAEALEVPILDLFERDTFLTCHKCSAHEFILRQITSVEFEIKCNNCGTDINKTNYDKLLYLQGYRVVSSGKVKSNVTDYYYL